MEACGHEGMGTVDVVLPDVLSGTKGWFLWNGASMGRDWRGGVRRLMHSSGAQSLALKTYDGNREYGQPYTVREVRDALEQMGPVIVGAWGYHYGQDLGGEIAQVERALHQLQADFVILNVEDPVIEQDPATPTKWADALNGLRDRWPNASLYFCSHAQPRYHERQPYYQATVAGLIQQPMIYHTAMERTPTDAVDVSRQQYADYGLIAGNDAGAPGAWSAAGGAYDSDGWPIRGADILAWAERCNEWGATSHIWWAADAVMDRPDILAAIQASQSPTGKKKDQGCD